MLRYEVPLVIVGGGRVDRQVLLALVAGGARVIAADGGADVARLVGIVPEAVVGDIDSLSDADAWTGLSRVIKVVEQETTDFEKALYVSAAPVTIVLGATGRRFDHTLAAIDSLGRYGRDRRIILVDESDLALTLSGPFEFALEPGSRVSVHTLQAMTFSKSEGLLWPLDGIRLAPGGRQGTSNVATAGPFSVSPGDNGVWLLIVERKYLGALVGRFAPTVAVS